MKTAVLYLFRDHATAKLVPYNKEIHFPMEVVKFYSQCHAVLREAQENLIEFKSETATRYAEAAIGIIQQAQDRVNDCFNGGGDEEARYRLRLQEIEATEIKIEPSFQVLHEEFFLPDKPQPLNEDATYAVWLNRICKWVKRQLRERYIVGVPPGPLEKSSKLKFVCDNKQVYDAFRWMREKKWISATVEEIAEFIFYNIEFKEGSPGITTIRPEIARKGTDEAGRPTSARPTKKKRFNPENE